MKQYFHAAFSFLTVLVKGKEYSRATMQKSIYCYPFVGAVLFFLSACFSLLFQIILSNYLLSALAFLFCGCLLVRGLHHDGLADIADALGSGKTKEEFRRVLKDSRIGSFGVLALIFYFFFGTMLISQILEINIIQKNYRSFLEQMVFVGFWSRLGLLALPFCSPIYEPQNQEFSLSKILFENFSKNSVPAWYFFIFIFSAVCFNASLIIICTALSFLFSLPLYRLAQKEKGYNGDFLGANCLLWELAGFLSVLLFHSL
ncbi:MAG: adenosylcobinamide-GDP ribazoletransferase [Mailhella sp.]|nr:adenosylcobinamide-GDP ribazoletransferase [Mailhella sp.]